MTAKKSTGSSASPVNKGPFKVRLSTDNLLADIRRRLEQGHSAATAERAKRLAAASDDPELLRGLVYALADAMLSPPKKGRGRPRRTSPEFATTEIVDGLVRMTIDLDAFVPKTAKEMQLEYRRLHMRLSVVDQVTRILERNTRLNVTGAILEAARSLGLTESEARKAYYG